MDDTDRKLLTRIQDEFPLAHRPYQVLGAMIGVSEDETIARLAKLKEEKILRQVSAIFDTKSLGYKSTLVAMKFPLEHVDEGAAIINEHPGVSHNYKRSDEYNLWFTIAVPPQESLEEAIHLLARASGATETLILPTLRLFKIGVKLDLTGGEGKKADDKEENIYDESKRSMAKPSLTPFDIDVIRALQEDFPLMPCPYQSIAVGLGVTEEILLERARYYAEVAYMRRVAGILNHRNAGFHANAMVIWQVPQEKIEEVGTRMAKFREVSHCYQRPIFPDFPYAIYTMIHGGKLAECQKVVDQIVASVGSFTYKILLSTKEYKKIRLKYFTRELDEWRERQLVVQ